MKSSYDASIRLLARREHSVKELITKLSAKGHPLAEIHEALVRLQADNLQSDARFMEMLIRSRISQGKGPRWITHELEEHGFKPAEIKLALEAAEVCWTTLACEVRSKRFGPDLPNNFPEKAKQLRFLQYRGFDHQDIKEIFHR